jgi:hypothetical protein
MKKLSKITKSISLFDPFFVFCLILIISWQFCGLLVSEEKAISELEVQGYSSVKIIDRDWAFIPLRGGALDDVVRFEATATNPVEKSINVCIYSGWPFKGATVRSK